ncbi:MAG: A/G-specific adenine glycosylase [Burkholderiaceae bacterium]
MSVFAAALVTWGDTHGRRGLPWQGVRDPYRVWLSEIMLQQTQVTTVIGYYARFLDRFPAVQALAAASVDEVLPLWAGLGYYARARNLHACARVVAQRQDGEFPRSARELALLPGIGRSTAAAIAAFCFDERAAILDGNVKRVLARRFGVTGFPGQAAVQRRLWALAAELLPQATDMPAYTQALMDLGATVCTPKRPRCVACPVAAGCVARGEGRIDALPAARPPRALRVRRAWWLLALAQSQVLLQRRPASGLWGGLWVPPEFDTEAAARQAAERLAAAAPPVQPLPARRHAFTHYTLEYTPLLVQLPQSPIATAEPSAAQWFGLAEPALAVPTPVQRLLAELAASADPLRAWPTSAPRAA